MEFFPPGKVIDIMRWYRPLGLVSAFLVAASLVLLVFPGPRLGTDFAGGTEAELEFRGRVTTAEVRSALDDLGYSGIDVIAVQGHANRYIVRVRETSSISASQRRAIQASFRSAIEAQGGTVQRFDITEGGDKIAIRLGASLDASVIEAALRSAGAQVRNVNAFGASGDARYEAQLIGIGDRIVTQFQESFGEKAPETALRAEWVGPRAGAQLRDSAFQAVAYALIFIMLYVAFRFDIRFAPGAMASLAHDVIITLGVYVVFQREMALTTVAACLTILGYSINDTIVVYDRIRENMGRERGKTLAEIVNMSTSQVLSRSIITSGTTIVSVIPFLYYGTSTVKDLALAFVVGMGVGTYSSVLIAAPITEWFDRMFFAKKTAPVAGKAAAKAKSAATV